MKNQDLRLMYLEFRQIRASLAEQIAFSTVHDAGECCDEAFVDQ